MMNRRQVVVGLGAAPLVTLVASASRAFAECGERTEETAGPFWVDELLNHSDIGLTCP